MKIRISSLDQLFSDYIRCRDNWSCRRCGSQFVPPKRLLGKLKAVYGHRTRSAIGLHNMHCFTRGAQSTRFDEINCLSGCYGCHAYLDSHPNEKYEFFKDVIGQERFDSLYKEAHSTRKIDRGLIQSQLKQKMKEYYG